MKVLLLCLSRVIENSKLVIKFEIIAMK